MIASRTDPQRLGIVGILALLAVGLLAGLPSAKAGEPPAPQTEAPAGADEAPAPSGTAAVREQGGASARPLILSPLMPPGTLPLPALPESFRQENGVTPAESAPSHEVSLAESADGSSSLPGADGERLAPPDLAAIGLDEPDPAAGLPMDLWRASERRVISRLMSGLPVFGVAPAARERALRLMLIAAPFAPAGADDDGITLLRVRFDRLAAAGEVDRLLALGERLPPDFSDPKIVAHLIDAMLLVGRYDEACRLAETENRRDGSARWLIVLILCRALAGDTAGIDFLVGLLSETPGEEADGSSLPPPLAALGMRLADEINGIDPPAPAPGPDSYRDTRLTAALLALARLSRAPLPLAAVERADLLVLAALLGEEITTPAARLAAAHAALVNGIAPVERIAAIYAALRFASEERAALIENLLATQSESPSAVPAQSALLLDEARIEAALFQWVSAASGPADMLERAARALASSPVERAERLARLFSLPLAAIDPTAALGAHAASAFDIFLLAERPLTAWRWWLAGDSFALDGNPDDPLTVEEIRSLDRRAAVAAAALDSASLGIDGKILYARLARGALSLPPDRRARWLDIVLAHLDALGLPHAPLALELETFTPPDATRTVEGARAPIRATLWGRMMRAAIAGRNGEAMLAALILDAEAHGGGQWSNATTPRPFAEAAATAAISGLVYAGALDSARLLAARHLLISLWQAERPFPTAEPSPDAGEAGTLGTHGAGDAGKAGDDRAAPTDAPPPA